MEDDQEYEGGYGDDGMDQDEDEFGDEEPLEQEQEEQQEVRWGCLGRGVWDGCWIVHVSGCIHDTPTRNPIDAD